MHRHRMKCFSPRSGLMVFYPQKGRIIISSFRFLMGLLMNYLKVLHGTAAVFNANTSDKILPEI